MREKIRLYSMKTTGWIRGKEKIMDDCEIVGLYWQRSEARRAGGNR